MKYKRSYISYEHSFKTEYLKEKYGEIEKHVEIDSDVSKCLLCNVTDELYASNDDGDHLCKKCFIKSGTFQKIKQKSKDSKFIKELKGL